MKTKNDVRRAHEAAIVREFTDRGLIRNGFFVSGWAVGMNVPGVSQYESAPGHVLRECSDEQIAEIYRRYCR